MARAQNRTASRKIVEILPDLSRPSGRPRSEASRRSILEAAFRLLRSRPIEDVSTQQIASAAGVSTATLYRWWPTKEAVLLDSFFETVGARVPYPKNGSPLAGLRDHAVLTARFLRSEDGRVLARLLAAIQDDRGLREAFHERFFIPRRSAARRVIEQARLAGELPLDRQDTELIIDSIYGPQYFRLLIGHMPLDDEFAALIFDRAVIAARA